MTNRDAALRRYYRRIRSYLPCRRKWKNSILDEIRCTIGAFLAENPNAEYSEIEAHFGSPYQIAASYVDSMNTDELLRDLHIRKKITTIFAGTMAAILLIWALAVTAECIYYNTLYPGYMTETIGEVSSGPAAGNSSENGD